MPNPLGSFVWYELMTTDPDAARASYARHQGASFALVAHAHGGTRSKG